MLTQTQTHDITIPHLTSPLKKIYEDAGCLARWIALYEAVNLIADKGEERGKKLDDIEFKPLDIKDYINGVEDIIHRKILQDMYNINIYHTDNTEEKQTYTV
jgi:hypothetical protein